MEKTYLFYDLETSGSNPCFDQILQFAAIRTNVELTELERTEIRVRLNPDVIPDPEAQIIHRIPLDTMKNGESELSAMIKIHQWLNTPNTISCGYNTLNFDDEFLRFSFYRNLLTPYTHQWANQCGRMDLYPMTLIFYLYHHEKLSWGERAGKPSLKLEDLSIANQLTQGGMAHDAIVDVEATLNLARLFKRESATWDYLAGFFNKSTDLSRMSRLPIAFHLKQQPIHLALLLGASGANEHYQFPVLSLGRHRHYKNQTLWLRLDKTELSTVTEFSIPEATWVVRKKDGEPPFLLPFSEHYTQKLDLERQKISEKNLELLKNQPELLTAIIEYHCEYTYPKIPNVDPDAALYDKGFLSKDEDALCQAFHLAPPNAQKLNLLKQFADPTLRKIGLRLLGRHYPDLMNETHQKEFSDYLHSIYHGISSEIPIDYRGKQRLTPKNAMEKIHQLRHQSDRVLDETQHKLLDELEKFILELAERESA